MKGKVIYLATIVTLVILNLGTLSFIWFNRPERAERRHRKDVALFLEDRLHLTPVQLAQYRQLRKQHRMLMHDYQEHDKILHDHFFDLLPSQAIDSMTMLTYVDSIANNRKAMDLLTLEHFRSIRKILNTQQQKDFDSVFDETIQMVLPAPPPPPPRPE